MFGTLVATIAQSSTPGRKSTGRVALTALMLSLFLILFAGAARAQGSLDERELLRLSSSTSVGYGRMMFNRRSGESSVVVTIQNTSTTSLTGPLYYIIEGVTSGSAGFLHASRTTSEQRPCYDLGTPSLGVGQQVKFRLHFNTVGRGRVQFNAAVYRRARLVDFWLSGAPRVVVHATGSTTVVKATGTMENGEVMGLDSGIQWSSSSTTVASVNSQGEVLARSEGQTVITAVHTETSLRRSFNFIIALPVESGSTVMSDSGGLVTNTGASAYFPPASIKKNARIEVSSTIAEEDLPGTLPPGTGYAGAVEVTVEGQSEFEEPVEVRLVNASGSTATLFKVYHYDESLGEWVPTGWGRRDPDTNEIIFSTNHLTLFYVSPATARVNALATKHAPRLVISKEDVHPIDLKDFIAESQLWEYVEGAPDRLIPGAVAADLLNNYNQEKYYLALSAQARTANLSGATWGNAVLGGRSNASAKAATVYYCSRQWGNRLVIQYWFFYAGSALPSPRYSLQHEGDLEMMQVIFDEFDHPVACSASQHDYGEGRHWRDVEKDGDRPIVFVAEGSHATYFSPGFNAGTSTHGTGSGSEGFLGKVLPLQSDRCVGYSSVNTISHRGDTAGGGKYDLRSLDEPPDDAAEVLLRWEGLLGRRALYWPQVVSDDDGPFCVAKRNPKDETLGMYDHPVDFHRAFNFSTSNGILAYFRGEGVWSDDLLSADIWDPAFLSSDFWTTERDRIQMGERLWRLQDAIDAQYPAGEVQSRIDSVTARPPACPEAPVGQPELLAWYIRQAACGPMDYLTGFYVSALLALEFTEEQKGTLMDPEATSATWNGTVDNALAALYTVAGGNGGSGDLSPSANLVITPSNTPGVEYGVLDPIDGTLYDVFNFRQVDIPEGVTVRVVGNYTPSLRGGADPGNHAIKILSLLPMRIDGVLEVSGGKGDNAESATDTSGLPLRYGGIAGPGGGHGANCYTGTQERFGGLDGVQPTNGGNPGRGGTLSSNFNYQFGGGGGGAGNRTAGTNGLAGGYPSSDYNAQGGLGGVALDTNRERAPNVGGSGGASGTTAYYYAYPYRGAGAGGGGGGGAIALQSSSLITLGATGRILAEGGDGGITGFHYYLAPGAGGGGSGGSIKLSSTAGIQLEAGATLSVLGGVGGEYLNTYPYYYGGAGGDGGDGYLRFEAADTDTITGVSGASLTYTSPSTGEFLPLGGGAPSVGQTRWIDLGSENPTMEEWKPGDPRHLRAEPFANLITYLVQMAVEGSENPGQPDLTDMDPTDPDGGTNNVNTLSAWTPLQSITDLNGYGYSFIRVKIVFQLKWNQKYTDVLPYVDRLGIPFRP